MKHGSPPGLPWPARRGNNDFKLVQSFIFSLAHQPLSASRPPRYPGTWNLWRREQRSCTAECVVQCSVIFDIIPAHKAVARWPLPVIGSSQTITGERRIATRYSTSEVIIIVSGSTP